MQKINFVEKKAIEDIGDKYNKYDFQLSKIINFPSDSPISADGLSLLDDVEFFLSQPGFNKEVEAELFKLIQIFSIKYLRSRRGSNDQVGA